MKILHVTESLAAGVGHYLTQVIHGQVRAGNHVVLAHSVREDTPPESILMAQYAGLSSRIVIPMVTQVAPWQDLLAIRDLVHLIKSENPDVIHLHSSKAGVVGRVAARLCGMHNIVFYSPHGFAFLREDVSARKQRLFLRFEQLAARMGGALIACSQSEAELAKSAVHHPRVYLVENATELEAVPRSTGISNREVLVLNAGRVCYQKAPWRFKKVAEECVDLPARFVWMGSGNLESELESGNRKNLSVSGWLPREDVLKYLAQGGIYLMPSLWEGMPLALIEAQASGLPAVVPNVIGCKDVVIDGVTGFVCDSDEILLMRVRQLIQNPELRMTMSQNAIEMVKPRFSVNRLNAELVKLYADCAR